MGRRSTGTLVVDYLVPGRRLYLLATGTGLAPFLSIVRDPETYERFEQVVLVHGVRTADELAYRQLLTKDLLEQDVLGELVGGKFTYYPTVTRENFATTGRVTELMTSGKLFSDLGCDKPEHLHDRFMLCGNPSMLRDLKTLLEARGFEEGSTSRPGHFVIERAFVER